MPAPSLSREEVAQRILAEFRRSGYQGATLASLSEATGLGKSSLYHYFPNGKADMGEAALEAVGVWFGEHVMPTLAEDAPAEKRLKKFSAALSEFYAKGTKPCLTDLFTIGEAGEFFQQYLKQRLSGLIKALAAVVAETGVSTEEASRRAEDAMITMHGSLVVSRALGTTAPFVRTMRNFPGVLLGE
ncbi:TetR/AcrR family transcriptional regulator [Herbaspirillum rhizosphaerae]|uniref:TetR/AcrR family transcriptional regulator n=1 Tax=Herbaspirillum rhizosphaerae TaxID=346179 RepID=UPI00067D3647|nr:TetR/AcrR family transcriptional regulator [Herbaspirillum rhizosphaerae]